MSSAGETPGTLAGTWFALPIHLLNGKSFDNNGSYASESLTLSQMPT